MCLRFLMRLTGRRYSQPSTTYPYSYISVCLYICMFIYLYVYISVCLYICMFIYLYVYISVMSPRRNPR